MASLVALVVKNSPTNAGVAAETAHRRGREELPQSRGHGRQPRGATPVPRPRAAAERSYPTSEVGAAAAL